MHFWSEVIVPSATMIITVFATLYTVSQRVKNENREKHKPYLTLNVIEPLSKVDEFKYFLTVICKNSSSMSIEEMDKLKKKEYLSVVLKIDNIGYGVASNIKFYDLLTGNLIHGSQCSTREQNQKLFTTFDVAINGEKQVQAKIVSRVNFEDDVDHARILCLYQDLNGNVYDFIICINVKYGNFYDFFAYQRTSHSYTKWIKESKVQYRKILNDYKK